MKATYYYNMHMKLEVHTQKEEHNNINNAHRITMHLFLHYVITSILQYFHR